MSSLEIRKAARLSKAAPKRKVHPLEESHKDCPRCGGNGEVAYRDALGQLHFEECPE
jgi:hypothetical protein